MKKILNIIPGADVACILLYGDIGRGERVGAADVVAELLDLQNRYDRIDVRINSYGGEVYEGIAICNALRNSKAEINIYIDGIAASIASVIALCGKPLHMSRFAKLMLHKVSGGAYGTAEEIRQAAQEAENAEKTLAQIIANKCRIPADEVERRYFSGGNHWINAEEALEMGLIDSIYDIDGDVPSGSSNPEEIYRMTNRLNIQPQKDNDMAFLDEVRSKISLNDAATEQEILQHIAELENEAAKVPALNNRIEILEEERRESRKRANEALLNQAVSEGRIKEDQKSTFMNLLDSDPENATKLLETLPKSRTRIVDFIGGKGTQTEEKELSEMSWDEIDRANRLAELKNKYPELYVKKFEEQFKNKK